MAYKTGYAKSPDQLYEAIRNFAVNTVGGFTDPFDGNRGLSSFLSSGATGANVFSTFALQHSDTGAMYLFDFVPGNFMNNEATEHVLVGQLLDEPSGSLVINYENYVDSNLQEPQSDCTWTLTELSGVYTFTASMTTNGLGALSTVEEGYALVLIDQGTPTLRHLFQIETASVAEGTLPYDQTLTCTYLGSYDEVTSVTSSTPPALPANGSGDQDDFLLSDFSAYDTELLVQTRFGEFQSNMWGEVLSQDDIRAGWLPRSGRLDFTTTLGVQYHFYGGPTVGDHYFHMVLYSSAGGASHWWMGRVSAVGGPATYPDSNAGVFLATTGPHTDEYGTDTFQYAMDFKGQDRTWKNPSVMLTPYVNAASSTTAIPLVDGGYLGVGPTGASHKNEYGPTKVYRKTLESTRYSIQNGLNGFEGTVEWNMDGGRGRTRYPLRPASPNGDDVLENKSHYINPFSGVSAIAYQSTTPEFYTTPNSGGNSVPFWYLDDVANNWTTTGCALSTNAGYTRCTNSATNATLVSDQFASFSAQGNRDVIEMRLRLVSGDASTWVGRLLARDLNVSTTYDFNYFQSPDWAVRPEPAGLSNNEWVTVQWVVGNDVDYWQGNTFDQIRFDLFSGTGSDSVVFDIEYVTFMVTKEQIEGMNGSSGSHSNYLYLGEVPGVFRGTALGVGSEAFSDAVALGDDVFDGRPVRKAGAVGDRERPPHLEERENSGLSSYIYKR